MKTLLVIFFFLPIVALSQDKLIIKGKMHFGETKVATVQIIENDTDTTHVTIDKKKFTLPELNARSEYQLIFKCGDQIKRITIQPREGEKQQYMFLDIDWTNE